MIASCRKAAHVPDVPARSSDVASPRPLISVKHVGELRSEWYSRQLAALEEPSLDPAISPQSPKDSIRFLWLRTFDPPVAIRIERNDNGATLFLKEADGKGGYSPGTLRRSERHQLTDAEWESVVAAINECGFWTMPIERVQEGVLEDGRVVSIGGGSDGAEWILEVARGSTYRVIHRNTPGDDIFNKDQAYRECCLLILSLSQLEVPAEKLY